MVERNPHLRELGQFLKARRGERAPEDVGLATRAATVRRVSGLRREEIASTVAISPNYYTRIEQGRMAPSPPVLAAILRALRLTPDQRAYAEDLLQHAERGRSPRIGTQPVRPTIQRLLDQLTETPAMVLGRYLDVLAWNTLMAAVVADFGKIAPEARNYARIVFTDPGVRSRYPDWQGVARSTVAVLRMETADFPDDPLLMKLVDDLSVDQDFRRWWAARHVARPDFGCKAVQHPALGEMTFDWNIFRYIEDPGQRLMLWSPASAETADKLQQAGSGFGKKGARPNTPVPDTG